MTQDEIIEMARQAGVRDDERIFEFSQYKYLERFVNLVAAKVTQQEQERCCAIVFGQCESDNVAQRTVNAIRGEE